LTLRLSIVSARLVRRLHLEGSRMTALVLVFCLQSSPGWCVEQRPIDEMAPLACVMRAEEYAANWLSDHPKWVLSRWRCERNVPREKPA
jgi:hypothetical protein